MRLERDGGKPHGGAVMQWGAGGSVSGPAILSARQRNAVRRTMIAKHTAWIARTLPAFNQERSVRINGGPDAGVNRLNSSLRVAVCSRNFTFTPWPSVDHPARVSQALDKGVWLAKTGAPKRTQAPDSKYDGCRNKRDRSTRRPR